MFAHWIASRSVSVAVCGPDARRVLIAEGLPAPPAKLIADVRSPVTERRHALRLGTVTPNRVSRKRSVEVWSKVSLHTRPPTVNGESTSIGTRNPRPTGPLITVPSGAMLSPTFGLLVNHSPAVPWGAV